jgi:AraC-like DNA-binding protein
VTPAFPHGDSVLALLRDREVIARLTEALRPGKPGAPPHAGATVRCVERVGDLLAGLEARPYALAVVEARDADGIATAEAVRELRERHPSLVVVGYTRVRSGMSSDVLALARAGVHELVVGGVDDVVVALRAALGSAAHRWTADRVLAELQAIVAPVAVPLLRYCLEHAGRAPTVSELARALGTSRQTLAARLRAAELPSPRELAVWCRLLLAAQLLSASGRPVDEVALTLDFPSGNGFRNTLRRHTGLGPADVRRGGVAVVLDAFRAALLDARTAKPGQKPAPPSAPHGATVPEPDAEPALAPS